MNLALRSEFNYDPVLGEWTPLHVCSEQPGGADGGGAAAGSGVGTTHSSSRRTTHDHPELERAASRDKAMQTSANIATRLNGAPLPFGICLQFDRTGVFLAVGCEDGSVCIWDFAALPVIVRELCVLQHADGSTRDLSSTTATTAAATAASTATATATAAGVNETTATNTTATTSATASEGGGATSAGSASTAKPTDAATASPAAAKAAATAAAERARDLDPWSVLALAWSHDNSALAGLTYDGTLVVWDVRRSTVTHQQKYALSHRSPPLTMPPH